MIADPRFVIEPADATLDVRRRITLAGFAGGALRIQAWLEHPDGSRWHSQAEFTVRSGEPLDLDRQAPSRGDWHVPDAMGVVWAMRRESAPAVPELTDETRPLTIRLRADSPDGQYADAQFTQRHLSDGVVRREIQEAGLVGTLFTPGSPGPHPAIMVLNGSGGGIPRQRAALYAAHGYEALALGYFKAPGLPDTLSGMPLEYFQRALIWMHQRLAPAHDFVAVTGQSRGGELALLLASRFPEQVGGVIAYVPSSVVHGTLRAGRPGEAPDSPAWTWQGRPLRNVWQNNPQADWTAFLAAAEGDAPVRQAPAFQTPMRNVASVQAARIEVERIRGPVMLISGTDDGFWPSTAYSEEILRTLHAHDHAWPVEHVRCAGAGHAIGLPHVPATLIAKPHPVAGVLLTGGGSAQANAQASEASWNRIQAFLRAAVQARAVRT